MSDKSTHLTFRLPAADARLLAGRARALGLSSGMLARLLVLQSLTDSHTAELAEEVARQRVELAGLREEFRAWRHRFALAVEALLVDAGKAEPDEAAAWVREALAE
jgi:hypothetical protein